MGLIAVVFAALGTTFGSIVEDMQGFQLIMNFTVLPRTICILLFSFRMMSDTLK